MSRLKNCFRVKYEENIVRYGIRERTIRVGIEKDYSPEAIPEQYLDCHYPQKVSYSLEHLLADLLNFSGRCLVVGGRLVYWLPVIRQHYSPDNLPVHPALTLVDDMEQVLSSHTSRRLIVMEKISESGQEDRATVSPRLALFKDQFFLPLAANISKKERKARIKEFGHLNLSEQEIAKFSSS